MPQAVVVAALPAAIGAVAGVAGAVLGKRSQDKALKAQMQASDEAILYERQKEMQANREKAEYNRQYSAWLQNRGGGRKQTPSPIPQPGPVVGQTLGTMLGGGPVEMTGTPLTGVAAAPDAQAPQTLADLGEWSDWSRYGARPSAMGGR